MKMNDLVWSNDAKKLGNNRVEIVGGIKLCYYYSTVICKVNPFLKKFGVDTSYGTKSTSKNCGIYRKELESAGYTEIEFDSVDLDTRN